MVVYVVLAFLVGGAFGMLGMAVLASGPKANLLREMHILRKRLEFLEKEDQKKHYQPVKDPRSRVHTLVN